MKDILARIAPELRSRGFKGSGQNYRKETREAVMVINFQKSSGGDRFYVNLGVQPLFLPTEGGERAEAKRIKEYDCAFRRRLKPPEGMFGWPYDMKTSMVDELRARISSACDEGLFPLAGVPGPITELTPEQFSAQGADSIFGGTHPRNALNFARIALSRGDVERAKSFAELGLAGCPAFASGLKVALQKVLKSTEPHAAPDGGPSKRGHSTFLFQVCGPARKK